jgi:serine/threonine protein kinase
MIERVQVLHENGIIHRDMKPDNFMLGHSDNSILHMIDFGLSKCYLREGQHIPPKERKKITGTIRYASLNLHEGSEPSRRDDLISVGYMLIYFLKGRLPWQGLYASTKDDRYQMIWDMKQDVRLEDLCDGLPNIFIDYLRDCYKLEFTDDPEYDRLLGGLKTVLKNTYLDHEKIIFDWSIEDSNTISLIDFDTINV